MENYLVKDLMVPLSEYATVSEKSTLLDAMLTLEKVQTEFDRTKYRHRSVLVLDKNKKVVGKLSFIDVLIALNEQKDILTKQEQLGKFGFSSKLAQYISMQQHVTADMQNLCVKASKIKVEDFMQAPTEGEYVEVNIPLKTAIYQLVTGDHPALLVTQKKNIVGILRLTDVFAAVFHTMKACDNSS